MQWVVIILMIFGWWWLMKGLAWIGVELDMRIVKSKTKTQVGRFGTLPTFMAFFLFYVQIPATLAYAYGCSVILEKYFGIIL